MTNQHTDEMREERRHTKPEFNGCVRYKRGEYCQPCVSMASNYTYTGEHDRRGVFHQYADEISEITRYQAATASAEAKYLPVIEKLVEKLQRIRSTDEGSPVLTYQKMEELADEALTAAAPYRKLMGGV